jgi:hypothetical protein
LTLTVNWDRSGETIACASQTIRRTIAATNPAWKKWRPSDPTSPHWYDVQRSRLSLAEFYGDGASDRIGAILSEMAKHSSPIKPRLLGAIGKDHFAAKLSGLGVAQETFHYQRAEFEHGGLPYLAEVAFGYCPDGLDPRRIITGVNWSVAIGADPFRHLGQGGESLDAILTKQRAGRNEPVLTVLHLACPRIEYLDRGKSSVVIPGSRAW